ncbi:MAG: hypothetical protein QME70_04120 [Bacillota bacterium]|nr:hypothetical protein [Bacillota bacterium]
MRSPEAHDQYEVVTKEMVTALAEEVEAIKKDGGSQRVPLYGGVLRAWSEAVTYIVPHEKVWGTGWQKPMIP